MTQDLEARARELLADECKSSPGMANSIRNSLVLYPTERLLADAGMRAISAVLAESDSLEERLSREEDHYFDLMSRKNADMAVLKAQIAHAAEVMTAYLDAEEIDDPQVRLEELAVGRAAVRKFLEATRHD